MMLFGCPVVIITLFNELDWTLTWNVEDMFTRVFAFKTVAFSLVVLVIILIDGGIAVFCGAMIGVVATHVIYSWILRQKIFDDS